MAQTFEQMISEEVEAYRMIPRGSSTSSSSSSSSTKDFSTSLVLRPNVGGCPSSCCSKKSKGSSLSPGWLAVSSKTEGSRVARPVAPGALVPVEEKENKSLLSPFKVTSPQPRA